ncbi:MAG: hypothetical protein ACJASX_002252, partial [Limisphaerales bacterium]
MTEPTAPAHSAPAGKGDNANPEEHAAMVLLVDDQV